MFGTKDPEQLHSCDVESRTLCPLQRKSPGLHCPLSQDHKRAAFIVKDPTTQSIDTLQATGTEV